VIVISNCKNIKSELFDKNKLPQHLAIIMDGNGRWAEKKGLPRSIGHREGAKVVKRVIVSCLNFHIPILTFFAFSTENWKRPKNEITYLLKLFERTLSKEKANLIKNNTINYGGRAEIVDALKSITLKIKEEKLNIEEINENTIEDNLYTRNIPNPDLLIRTAGEMRISNFMIWQIAYTEFWVTPVFWPDFDEND
jgi:undecaprenyl diphosphate synthase